jgi:hypothetical protein
MRSHCENVILRILSVRNVAIILQVGTDTCVSPADDWRPHTDQLDIHSASCYKHVQTAHFRDAYALKKRCISFMLDNFGKVIATEVCVRTGGQKNAPWTYAW